MDDLMLYDRIDWHADSCRDAGLGEDAGGKHIGYFIGWLAGRGYLDREVAETFLTEIRQFEERAIGAADLAQIVGGSLASDMVREDMRPFVKWCYQDHYLPLYEEVFGSELSSPYQVEDNSSNYRRACSIVDHLFGVWSDDQRQPV